MATQPQNWDKVKALFHEALELDRSERSAFLRNKCPDAEVRAEVERLLAEYDQAGGFLSTLPPRQAEQGAFALNKRPDTLESTTSSAANTTRLNESSWNRRYKFVQTLGQGGMGRTILAERCSDSMLLCLKFLYPKGDPRAAEQECRALMRLRHTSIVSLIDFSLVDNPPWLAMEYAPGSTLEMYLKTKLLCRREWQSPS